MASGARASSMDGDPNEPHMAHGGPEPHRAGEDPAKLLAATPKKAKAAGTAKAKPKKK